MGGGGTHPKQQALAIRRPVFAGPATRACAHLQPSLASLIAARVKRSCRSCRACRITHTHTHTHTHKHTHTYTCAHTHHRSHGHGYSHKDG